MNNLTPNFDDAESAAINQDIISNKSAEVAKLNRQHKRADMLEKKRSARLTQGKEELKKMFEAAEIEKITAHGYTFYISSGESVKIPQTVEDKAKLFRWLHDNNLFMQYATVNSTSLNTLYASLSEAAFAKAIYEGAIDNFKFEIPGIGEPTPYSKMNLLKASKKGK